MKTTMVPTVSGSSAENNEIFQIKEKGGLISVILFAEIGEKIGSSGFQYQKTN